MHGTKSKISLIAICMDDGPHTAEPQALVIGTRGKWKQPMQDGTFREWAEGEDWRYACYPLSELASRLALPDQELLYDHFDAAGDINTLLQAVNSQPNGALSQDELKGLDENVFTSQLLTQPLGSNISGLPPTTQRVKTALVARNIERISFFSYDRGERALDPFAVLDTARVVDQKESTETKKHPFCGISNAQNNVLGSRLILFPDLSDPVRPGALSAISINLQISTAVNGHHIEERDKERFDRHDTRMLFELSVAGGGWVTSERKNMWYKMARGSRGMRFDEMDLWCTLAPFKGKLKDRSDTLSISGADVLEFAYQKKVQVVGNENGGKGVFFVPALAKLGVSDRTLIKAEIIRQFGFRSLAAEKTSDIDTVRKIGWRFETFIKQGLLLKEAFLSSSAKALLPFEQSALEEALSGQAVLISQEQRLAAISSATTLAGRVRTIFTIRLGANKTPQRYWERIVPTIILGRDKKLSKIDERVTAFVLSKFNAVIDRVHKGLESSRDGEPLSLLPRLANKNTLAWHIVGSIVDSSAGSRTIWNEHTKTITGEMLDVRLTVLEPCQQSDMWNPEKKQLGAITVATLPRLINVARRFPSFNVELGAARNSEPSNVDIAQCTKWPACQSAVSEADPNNVVPGIRLAIKVINLASISDVDGNPVKDIDKKEVPDTQSIILQAFRFKFSSTYGGALGEPLVSDILLTSLEPEDASDSDDYPIALSALIRLPLAEVEPAAEDDISGMARETSRKNPRLYDRRLPNSDTPLLFDMGKRDERQSPVHLSLTAYEQVGRNFTHTVALSLTAVQENPADNASAGVGAPVDSVGAITGKDNELRRRVMIIEPSPFRIAAVNYSPITGLGTPRDSQVAVWNKSGEGGESWRVRDDKQIVDIIMQPQALGEAMEKNRSGLTGLPPDIQPGKPSAARFGSLTLLKVDPTYADTAFREPGWNLRRILGYAAQRSPGSRVVELRLEMLYGLLASIRSENINITEIAGAIGEPPAALLDTVKSSPHISRYLSLTAAVLKAEQSRLAVEKLWRDKPGLDLQISDGVSFRIRRNEPDVSGGPSTPLRWPVPGAVPVDTDHLIDNKILQATFSNNPDDSQSFPGGLAWAFESANILMDVYGKPKADSGSVRGVFLTALGGFGSQRALFAHRKSIVESETTLGRVQRYRLERIGRISSLWHRAKHVIVYERTVVPPAQFYNKPPIGLRQDEHLGRVIPRKVEEYVEILTPVRHYPEDGTSIRDNGFILGAEFKSIKIRVDSAWGHDVRREGWEVPLWNKMFLGLGKSDNPDDPSNLFPMPQICMLLAGKDGKPRPIEIADPEKLHFYTSVLDTEDDNTDAWKAVRDVDFCDFPMPQLGKTEPHSADLSDAMLPSAPAIIPGYERFTLSLVPSNELVSITHGRGIDNGPLTTMRNVTISRATGIAVTSNTPIQAFGSELAAKAANVRAELDRRVGRVLAELNKVDPRNPSSLQEQAKARIAQAVDALAPGELKKAIKETKDKLNSISSDGPSWPKSGFCEGIKAKVKAQIDGQFNRLMIVAADMAKAAAVDLEKNIDEATDMVSGQVEKLITLSQSADKAFAELSVASQSTESHVLKAARRKALQFATEVATMLDELERTAEREIELATDSAIKQVRTLPQQLLSEMFERRNATKADLGAVIKVINGGVSNATDSIVDKLNGGIAAAASVANIVTRDGGLTPGVKDETDKCIATLGKARKDLDSEVAKIELGGLPPEARRLFQIVDMGMAAVVQACLSIKQGKLDPSAMTEARSKLASAKEGIDGKLSTVEKVVPQLGRHLDSILDKAYGFVAGPDGFITQALPPAEIEVVANALTSAKTGLLAAISNLSEAKIQALDLIAQLDGDSQVAIEPQLLATANTLAKSAQVFVTQSQEALKVVHNQINLIRTKLKQEIVLVLAKLRDAVVSIEQAIGPVRDQLLKEVGLQCEKVEGFASSLLQQGAGALADSVNKLIEESIDIQQYGTELQRQIETALAGPVASINEMKTAAEKAAADFAKKAEQSARQLVGSIQESVRDITGGADLQDIVRRAEGVYQKGDGAFRALAALGDPPKSNQGIDFNRKDVQFVMNGANQLGIDMTPSLALINRATDQIAAVENAGKAVGDLLNSFGVRLPLSNIGEALIPDSLKGLSVADMLPDIAGIDLKGLLQEVGFPDLDDSKAIKISHRVDQASMQVVMDADLDIPFGTSALPLMSFGPVQILIDTARLTASSRIVGGLSKSKTSMNGKIFGDWRIVCSGQTILTFRKTGLYFDDSGKIDFRIQPDRIELADALKFITDLMSATGQKGGLRVEPFVRGGIPSGVAATLDMVLPPIQTGAFGISDLSLHVMFGLAALPEFEIVSEMSIGMRTAPFTLNVWILNGGGYLMQRLSYLPSAYPKALMTYTLEVGVVVGLGLGFSFGVVSGGVWVQVGCSVAFTWSNGGGSTTAIRVFLLIRGNVDVCGLITASISLLFEITYDGASIIGAGTLTVRAKISMFYTLEVDQHVEYVFSGEKKQIGNEDYAAAYC